MTTRELVGDAAQKGLIGVRKRASAVKSFCFNKIRHADDWLAQRHASRSGRLTYRMAPGLANAALLAVVVGFTAAWADAYYARLGLTLSDAQPSLLWLAVTALGFAAVVGLFSTTVIWASLVLPGTSGGKIVLCLLLVFAVVGVAGFATNGFGGTAALVVVSGALLARSVRRRLAASHRVALFAKVVMGFVLALAISSVWSAAPLTYEQSASGHPRNITHTFMRLPDDFVLDLAGDKPRPLVVLDRSAWMTVIDPCSEAPYEKELLRFDQVDIRPTSLDEALAACDQAGR